MTLSNLLLMMNNLKSKRYYRHLNRCYYDIPSQSQYVWEYVSFCIVFVSGDAVVDLLMTCLSLYCIWNIVYYYENKQTNNIRNRWIIVEVIFCSVVWYFGWHDGWFWTEPVMKMVWMVIRMVWAMIGWSISKVFTWFRSRWSRSSRAWGRWWNKF